MENFKFRVWDNVDYMSSGFTFQHIKDSTVEFTNDCPIMQFTGLTDKNGKEIYEGDILQTHFGYDFLDSHKYEVVYRAHQAVWGMKNLTKGMIGLRPFCTMENSLIKKGIFEDFNEFLEIIGNIYENPELLK